MDQNEVAENDSTPSNLQEGSGETFIAMMPNGQIANLKTDKSETLDVEMKPRQPSFDVDVTSSTPKKEGISSKKLLEETNGHVKNGDAGNGKNKLGRMVHSGIVKYSRIFKKVSPDGNMVLFLPQREIMVTETKVEPLMGVALIHQVLS